MNDLKFSREICERCETIDCLTRCQYLKMDLRTAKEERQRLLRGEKSRVLEECVTCYACEEYCPYGNHPFYHLVDQQEKLGIWPVPKPITKQQVLMMAPRGKITPKKVQPPVINMCYFPMLTGSIRGKLFEGASTIVGSDIFCNIMWLHFGKNSVIRERLPEMIANIWEHYLKDSGVKELICFHDECYGTYTHLAPAFGIPVPFKPIHIFDYLNQRLDELKDRIKPLGQKVAYQRSCSNRLVPETQPWVDEIFKKIGVERPERKYDRENALCCGAVFQAQQRDDLADDVQKRNLDDMTAAGAKYCVFSCPACLFTLGESMLKRGIMPLMMNDLCQIALGEGMKAG